MKGSLVLLGAVLLVFVLPLVGFTVMSVPLLFTALEEDEEAAGGTCSVVSVQEDQEEEPTAMRGVPSQWVEGVRSAAETAGLPPEVIASQVEHESSFQEDSVNPESGAAGMAQAMPGTWALYGQGDPMNGEDALAFMGTYMGKLMELAGEHTEDPEVQVRMALAAYVWGPGNMDGVGWDWEQAPADATAYVNGILDGAQVGFSQDCEPVMWDGDLGTGEWTHLLPGSVLLSGYCARNVAGLPLWAQNHVGLDYATPNGGPVVAPTDLRVTSLFPEDGCVMAKATTTPEFGFAFCHLDDFQVEDGGEYPRGTVLGTEGTRAGSVGVGVVRHLHTELYDPSAGDPEFPGPDAPGVMDPTEIYRAKVK